jgi:hypothetical protein
MCEVAGWNGASFQDHSDDWSLVMMSNGLGIGIELRQESFPCGYRSTRPSCRTWIKKPAPDDLSERADAGWNF